MVGYVGFRHRKDIIRQIDVPNIHHEILEILKNNRETLSKKSQYVYHTVHII